MTQIDKPIAPVRGMGLNRSNILIELHFGYSNSTFRTNFYTSLTAETLVSFYWISFSVYHLENLCWTCCDTFFITTTFIFVNDNFKHYTPPYGEINKLNITNV